MTTSTLLRSLLLLAVAVAPAPVSSAQDGPPSNPLQAPDSELARRAAAIVDAKAPSLPADQAARRALLVRDELRFTRTRRPLQLGALARALAAEPARREAVLTLLEQGALELRARLAPEGAEHDVGAAAALAAVELWQLARGRKAMERHADVVHAQVVAVLAAPEVAELPNMAKQRFWEQCVGVTTYALALREGAADDAARAEARSFAARGFEALFGAAADAVDIGGRGLVSRRGARAAPARPAPEPGAAAGAAAGAEAVTITFDPPEGFTAEDLGWARAYRQVSPDRLDDGRPDPHSGARHELSIFVLPPRRAPGGSTATFDAIWREQLDAFELGDTLVHYRARLRCGLVVDYMGNFFRRLNAGPDWRGPRDYAVVHVIELGGGMVQPIVSIAAPRDPDLGMDTFKESNARTALAWSLAAMLDSAELAEGFVAPHPSGGVFQPSDLIGEWETSSSAFGGFYVDADTGAGAGAAVHSSGGHFYLRPDGTYEYAFAFASYNPQLGNSSGSTRHEGRYRLDGDIPRLEPSQPIGYEFRYCAVGVGTRRLEDGLHRVLVLVGGDSEGQFLAPYLVPEWDAYRGTMDWYVERTPLE